MFILCLYSKNPAILQRWEHILEGHYQFSSFHTDTALYTALEKEPLDVIVLYDYNAHPEAAYELLEYLDTLPTSRMLLAFNSKPTFEEGMNFLTKGARAYANAYIKAENLIQAIETVRSGNIWLTPTFIHTMLKNVSLQKPVDEEKISTLTDREREIVNLVSVGMSNKAIAVRLDITEQTVKSHLSHIYEKLNVSNRINLAMLMK